MKVLNTLADDIRTKQLKWYVHIQRMAQGRLPQKVTEWFPINGRRRRGRQRKSGTGGIAEEMQTRNAPYSGEIWPLKQQTANVLLATEMDFCRKAARQ